MNGYRWMVEIGHHIGLWMLVIGFLFAVSIGSVYGTFGWQGVVYVVLGLVLLVFAQGTYETWQGAEASAGLARANSVASEKEAERAKEELRKLQAPVLDLIYDPNDGSCHERDLDAHHFCYLELYRVGVVNLSLASVEGVVVMLRSFTPQGAPFLPVPLHQMHDHTEGLARSVEGARVNPGRPTTYATVTYKRYEDASSANLRDKDDPTLNHIWLEYATMPHGPIPDGEYVLTLEVQGQNVAARERRFRVWVDSGQLQFEGLE